MEKCEIEHVETELHRILKWIEPERKFQNVTRAFFESVGLNFTRLRILQKIELNLLMTCVLQYRNVFEGAKDLN